MLDQGSAGGGGARGTSGTLRFRWTSLGSRQGLAISKSRYRFCSDTSKGHRLRSQGGDICLRPRAGPSEALNIVSSHHPHLCFCLRLRCPSTLSIPQHAATYAGKYEFRIPMVGLESVGRDGRLWLARALDARCSTNQATRRAVPG